jgi:acrylyl-CoA reductase (NADPH)
MLCVMALEDAGIRPQDGKSLSPAPAAASAAPRLRCCISSAIGRAVSGRESTHEYLKSLGAQRILSRDEFAETRPLEKQLWAGALIPLAIRCWQKCWRR